MRPHPPTSTLFPYTPLFRSRPKAAQKPAPRPRAASERRTPRPSRIRHRPQRRRRPLGQKRLGRTQLTRPGHTHILAYNPNFVNIHSRDSSDKHHATHHGGSEHQEHASSSWSSNYPREAGGSCPPQTNGAMRVISSPHLFI